MTSTFYSYRPDTREFCGSVVAEAHPLRADEWLAPAFSTPIAPPPAAANQKPIFGDDTWTLVDDFRGETWFAVDGRPVLIAGFGNPQADGLTRQRPTLYRLKADGSGEYAETIPPDDAAPLPPWELLTTLPPPATPAKTAAVFAAGTWSVVVDHRGETWWRADGSVQVIAALGDPAALGLFETRPTQPLTSADVNLERDRRLALGCTFNGVHFQTDRTSMDNIQGAAQIAEIAIRNGVAPGNLRWFDPAQDFTWIAADNNAVPMDAQTMIDFGLNVAERRWALVRAARAIKDDVLAGVPVDVVNDPRWPA